MRCNILTILCWNIARLVSPSSAITHLWSSCDKVLMIMLCCDWSNRFITLSSTVLRSSLIEHCFFRLLKNALDQTSCLQFAHELQSDSKGSCVLEYVPAKLHKHRVAPYYVKKSLSKQAKVWKGKLFLPETLRSSRKFLSFVWLEGPESC